ncbi:MAG: DNA gyrase subunit A [Candidatus Theseobacter exili]|nr:DNA gyrase subunit A [Candidatus Theseobacter exili]
MGLSTRILPHNFCELIQASIDVLEGKPFEIFPDFPTGGMADISEYNEGRKGGKVRVRARIEIADRRHLVIRDIPYGITTTRLIDSIIKANDTGKIKINKVVDNTARDVEVLIELPSGVSPEVTVDALYAFTDCEILISPNCCVIVEERPCFLSVYEMLKKSTSHTLILLRRELEVKKKELDDKWQYSSLERIFIENRIYRDIEECKTWEEVLFAIEKGLKTLASWKISLEKHKMI